MVTRFEHRVYTLTRRIPKGRVTSYGIIAAKLGTSCSRAVGNALHRNPFAPQVPCHRVVRSDGSVGGFASGTVRKERLLRKEGIEITDHTIRGYQKICYRF